ncbi:MAG: hypothetical protein HY518_02840 [Candidatus Aenigmarchaeota archaeon]|nr:hypothetical protein [Candidatus Aenigmarchaeota archaeon]
MFLDSFVVQALDAFGKWEYPKMGMVKGKGNVFIGSGNAYNTGCLFARELGGVAVDTSTYVQFLSKCGQGDISISLISASGGKDAVDVARFLKEKGFAFNLITVNSEAPAREFVTNSTFVLPAFREPPTFNVSTYGSMLYWLFREDLDGIRKAIEKLEIPDLRKHRNIIFLSSDSHAPIARMAATKVMESLAGVSANGDGVTNGMHRGFMMQPRERAIFAINLDMEFGSEEVIRIKDSSFLGALYSAYYLIGKNQTWQDLKNIAARYKDQSEMLGWKFRNIM